MLEIREQQQEFRESRFVEDAGFDYTTLPATLVWPGVVRQSVYDAQD